MGGLAPGLYAKPLDQTVSAETGLAGPGVSEVSALAGCHICPPHLRSGVSEVRCVRAPWTGGFCVQQGVPGVCGMGSVAGQGAVRITARPGQVSKAGGHITVSCLSGLGVSGLVCESTPWCQWPCSRGTGGQAAAVGVKKLPPACVEQGFKAKILQQK